MLLVLSKREYEHFSRVPFPNTSRQSRFVSKIQSGYTSLCQPKNNPIFLEEATFVCYSTFVKLIGWNLLLGPFVPFLVHIRFYKSITIHTCIKVHSRLTVVSIFFSRYNSKDFDVNVSVFHLGYSRMEANWKISKKNHLILSTDLQAHSTFKSI